MTFMLYFMLSRWHIWFAWYPVTINDKWVWGRKVCRRTKTMHSSNGGSDWHKTYYYAPLADWDKLKDIPVKSWEI
jgi:hypothetical protein